MKAIALLLFSAMVLVAEAQQNDSIAPAVCQWKNLPVTKEETRLRRQILEGSTASLSHFEVHASTLAPGQAPHPPHIHTDEEELVIVKEGQLAVTIGDRKTILGPGSIAFIMPGDLHGFENAGGNMASYYVLKYKGRTPTNMERAKSGGGSFTIDWSALKSAPTGKGYRRDFFNKSTSQLAQFEMHSTALNADSVSHAPHTHRQEEIILVLRGNVQMYIDGKLTDASPGDIVFLPSLVPHALKNTGKEQCEYLAFQWKN